ncbi:sugar ABC transporter ATP-binding protein [Cellulosimicrobium cellulans]|uniref:ATP-binding cassette domain-containing protein n=1 Tax=Cellulosimicrobium cellulans TaxID=1710 RepID=UPI001EDA6197|nr:ATP-binding cassette domain-containing protein [Cellulosimicrobium cellulans]UKJ63158.1 sugar ABC transporter ATP-binding protein [Cellulosimicrobium cellulans]
MAELLRASALRKLHGQRTVLDGLDLSLPRGSILGLVGANGVGKSTLIGILGGRLRPDSGQLHLSGEPYRPDSEDAARAAGVSVIEQNFVVPRGLTVPQAVYRNTFLAERDDAILGLTRRLAAQAGVDVPLEALVDDLDGAQQAMVEVLRTMAEEAQLVIFDEVAATLDDADVARLHAAVRALRGRGCSVMYVAHRLDEVRALCDTIAVVRDGRVVASVGAQETTVDDLVLAMLGRSVPRPDPRPELVEPPRPALVVERLSVGDRLRDATFSVAEGEVLGVVGLRGSGADELVSALSGHVPATFDGVQVRDRHVTALAGDPGICPVGDPSQATDDERIIDVVVPPRPGQSELAHRREAGGAVHRLRLSTSDVTGPASSLSGGDRQRLSVAAAARREDADVLVLSHPTRGVDVGGREIVHRALREALDRGCGIVLHSHDLSELLAITHRVLVLRSGQVVAALRTADADEDAIMRLAAPDLGGDGARPGRHGSTQLAPASP